MMVVPHDENTMIRQGDVLLIPIGQDEIPTNTKDVAATDGRHILAHGEATGHHHSVSADHANLVTYEQANELFLLVHGLDTTLVHQEHTALTVTPGAYRVVRQVEYAPEGLRRVQD